MRYKPMLAYPVSKKPIDYNEPVFIQPKLDGVRCLIQCDGNPAKRGVIAFSRTGKEWKNIDHILEQLIPFFIKYPNVVLDGELYNHDLKDDFEKIISLVRKQKPTDKDRQEAQNLVQFHCYDMIDPNFDVEFDHRDEFIQSQLCFIDYVHTLDTHRVFREDDAKVYHARNLDAGYEGSIVRLNTKYQQKRSHSLRKFKDFHDKKQLLSVI